MSRKLLVVGNWKMNLTAAQGVQLMQGLDDFFRGSDNVEVVVAPPFTAIHSVATVIDFDKMRIGLGAQNMYWEDVGAYTGEISPTMLKAARVNYVILGHSERREYFDEDDVVVSKKLRAALKNDLLPILCCGESLEVREDEETLEYIEEQIRAGLKGVNVTDMSKVTIAYEPIWAIGTGKVATPRMAEEVCAHIRHVIDDMFGLESVAAQTRILYGGSVKGDNAELIFAEPNIDGALVGGAAISADSFIPIIAAAMR
ncbi:MAG: triose-phosphate isomerase [Coriobacteriia bacterium]|nr:triose-phosphate isomerase [Coriobacteriia bacterium]